MDDSAFYPSFYFAGIPGDSPPFDQGSDGRVAKRARGAAAEPRATLLGMDKGWRGGLRDPAFLYGVLGFCKASVHNVFVVHSCDVFVRNYQIDPQWFFWSQVVFMIWNSVNDPLFGWLSDRGMVGPRTGGGSTLRVSKAMSAWRAGTLARAGAAMCGAFGLLWIDIPGLGVGPRFLAALCLYDTFLTLVDLHHHALLVELSLSTRERARFSLHASIFAMFGSWSVVFSHQMVSQGGVKWFARFCTVLAVAGGIGIWAAAGALRRCVASGSPKTRSQDVIVDNTKANAKALVMPPAGVKAMVKVSGAQDKHSRLSAFQSNAVQADTSRNSGAWGFALEMSANPNFVYLNAVNIVQTFHCHFNSTMLPVFLAVLVAGGVTPGAASALVAVSFLAPHLVNAALTRAIPTTGLYIIIWSLLVAKVAAGIVMAMAATPTSIVMLGAYLALNRVFTEGVCRLMDLAISDLADEDYIKSRRKHPVPALVFGSCALLSRAGQSLAPLFGFWFIARESGAGTGMDGGGSFAEHFKVRTNPHLRSTAFRLLVWVPVLCGAAQALAWSKFSLRGRYLCSIKSAAASIV